MEILRLREAGIETVALRAARVLREGGVILFPTDTLYGLGADALSDAAVAKIYAIKGRDDGKPIHGIVADTAMAQRYGEWNDLAKKLCDAFFPGALTLIVAKKSEFSTGVLRGIDTFGFRIPANDLCIEIARTFDAPFTATSANKSGVDPSRSFDETIERLADRADLIDLAIDAGELVPSLPSTVVGLIGGG